MKAARFADSHATTVELVEDWRERAACVGHDPELFFPDKGELSKRLFALSICSGCPVRQQCLDEEIAIEKTLPASHRCGIFGGTTAADRGRILGANGSRKAATP